MSERDRRWMPALIAVFLLIGVAAWCSTFLPVEPSRSSAQPSEIPQKILCAWNGNLALFEGGDVPSEVYEVAIASLPTEERRRLEQGIVIESEEMLLELLENYTS